MKLKYRSCRVEISHYLRHKIKINKRSDIKKNLTINFIYKRNFTIFNPLILYRHFIHC